jgi:glucokinase
MLLAGDVGGTKTLLGLFERADPRPVSLATRSYVNLAFGNFGEILDAFARDIHQKLKIDAGAIGVAGPVLAHTSATLTNVPWAITAVDVSSRFGGAPVELLNDLEAMAYGVDVLTPPELLVLQKGDANAGGNAAVIAAGTGLGQAMLHCVAGRYIPVASEGGHADFAARSDREMDFARMLKSMYGRAEVEHVLSGPGLRNLHRFTHREATCVAIRGVAVEDHPAAISDAALDGRCPLCAEALAMFVSAYGAESGNLALRSLATGGVFLGGGIAPKILPALEGGDFFSAFLDKGPMAELLAKIPVKVILTPEAAMLGAATYAQKM